MNNRWEWMTYSACKNSNPKMFDNELDEDQPTEIVKAICVGCDVRTECLALHKYDEYGIWGGTTRIQRSKLREENTKVICPACRSSLITRQENTEICLSCGISWISIVSPVRL